jgi:hypothetical protein
MDVKVAVQDVIIAVQVIVQQLVHLTVQEIVMDHVKDVQYHVRQLVVGIVLVTVDQVVLVVVVSIVEQDVKDVVVQCRQIDLIVMYLMNMQ